MIKVFIFSLVVCSAVEQRCISIPSATQAFETYRDCALYGYKHSHDFLEAYDPKVLEDNEVYTSFSCKPSETI